MARPRLDAQRRAPPSAAGVAWLFDLPTGWRIDRGHRVSDRTWDVAA